MKIRDIQKAEVEATRRLKKHYRDNAYLCIDKVTFNLGDCEEIVELEVRVGYKKEENTYVQKDINAVFDMGIYHTPNELAAVLLTRAIEALDCVEFFEVR